MKNLRAGLFVLIGVWLAWAWYARHQFLPYDVNNTDIGTYLFQAQTFADGRLWRPTAEPRESFQQWQVVVRERSYAYYPPGHALFLAVPMALGLDPWLAPWLMSGLCLALVFAWGSRLFGPVCGAWSALLLALSPMFAANAASLLSHSTALGLTLFFLWAVAAWRDQGRLRWAFLAGAGLAAVFATRSVNAMALGLVWIPWVYFARGKSAASDQSPGTVATTARLGREIRLWSASLAGGLWIFIPTMVYYRILGGRWRMDLFTDYWPRNRFGFGEALGRGEPDHYFQTYANHDWRGMLGNWQYSFSRLAEWWSGSVTLSVMLLILVMALFAHLARTIGDADSRPVEGQRESLGPGKPRFPVCNLLPIAAWALLHIFLYSLYYTPSTDFSGPRYLTEILPALAVACGWAFAALAMYPMGKEAGVVLIIGLLGASSIYKKDFYESNQRGIAPRRQVERCVLDGARPPALVLLRSFWIGHPFPIFLNRPGLSDPILYACDRGAEDKLLVERHPERNAYILDVTPPSGPNSPAHTQLIQVYNGAERRWLKEPDRILAPFFVGGKFTEPLELRGETARKLFAPKPEEIVPQ